MNRKLIAKLILLIYIFYYTKFTNTISYNSLKMNKLFHYLLSFIKLFIVDPAITPPTPPTTAPFVPQYKYPAPPKIEDTHILNLMALEDY